MAKLNSGTRIFGTATVDSTLVVGNSSPTNSTSNTTGSLVVTGGVGITGNLYSGNLVITGSGNGIIFVDGTIQTSAGLANTGSIITVNSSSQLLLTNPLNSSTNSTGSLVITGGVGVQKTLWANNIILDIGTTTVAPLQFNAGNNLTTPVQGVVEYNGNNAFITADTSGAAGRGIIQASQFGVLATSATVASGGAFFTATVRPQLAQGQYHHFRYYLAWTKVTAGTLTYSFTPSAGTFTNLRAEARTYVAGAVLAAVTNMASITATASATTTSAASASIANAALGYTIIEGFVVPSTNCRLQLNVTDSAGTVTSALGSNFLVTNLGAVNIGNIG